MSLVTGNDIQNLKEHLKLTLQGRDIKATNVLQLTRQAMEVAANYKHLSGFDKKELVMDTINIMVEETKKENDERKLLNFVINEVGPPVIDDLVSAFKGDFTFKKSQQNFCPCFSLN